MSRNIPIALRPSIDAAAATTTMLLRIDPVKPGVASYGASMIDRAITYNDGVSEITYSSAIGMQPSTFATSTDGSVDNGEASCLLPEFEFPISESDIRAGAYDGATWTAYLVDFEHLDRGHVILGHGQIGQVKIQDDGQSFVEELFGLTKVLRQSLVERDSLSCRATFGSQELGSAGDAPKQRFPCGFDATTLLVSGTVTAVGLEIGVTFTASALPFAADALNPGMVFWQTGANAGRSNEVESNTSDGVVTLAFKTDFPIQVGDTFQIRPDCNKIWSDGDHGCLRWWASQRSLHFRGEPHIPIGDAGQLNVPGASVGPGNGGSVVQPYEDAE